MELTALPFLSDPRNMWLAVGVVLLLAEAIGASGVGLLFTGLGALAVGGALYGGMLASDAYVAQFALFFAVSAVWAALLWKPMQKFRGQHKRSSYNNIVGDTAIVAAGGLSRTAGGNVAWSGTIMKAELAGHDEALDEGAQVVITDVRGATLTVRPK